MVELCSFNSCRKLANHSGCCDPHPTKAWSFFDSKDKKKISKTASATPRGGKKGGYQNHVSRTNKVVIPFEKLEECNLNSYENGYVVRLLPEQIFNNDGSLRDLQTNCDVQIIVGENAFVLYRSHEMLELHPPLDNWAIRYLEDSTGGSVSQRRADVVDHGHYLLRLPAVGGGNSISKPKREEGVDQGIFAPEYASREFTYLSQIVLAWQIVHTVDSPYTTNQSDHIKAILDSMEINGREHFSFYGMMRGELSICPLCLKKLNYSELHDQIYLDGEDGQRNSAAQIQGATRSTVINLFHMMPLEYGGQYHTPKHVSWGHATCNSKLGQRKCWSLDELKNYGVKVATIEGDQISTFGWISFDQKMIRSPLGAVWIKITGEMAPEEFL